MLQAAVTVQGALRAVAAGQLGASGGGAAGGDDPVAAEAVLRREGLAAGGCSSRGSAAVRTWYGEVV